MLMWTLREKCLNGLFPDTYFPLFGLNTKSNGVNLRIQTESRKIQTRKKSAFGQFSHSAYDEYFFRI